MFALGGQVFQWSILNSVDRSIPTLLFSNTFNLRTFSGGGSKPLITSNDEVRFEYTKEKAKRSIYLHDE